jgi:hypothetical protein
MSITVTAINILTKDVYSIETDSSPIVGDPITLTDYDGKGATYKVIASSRTLDRKKAIKLKDVTVKDYLDAGNITVQVVPFDVSENLTEVLQDILGSNTLEDFRHSQDVLKKYLSRIKWVEPDTTKHMPNC